LSYNKGKKGKYRASNVSTKRLRSFTAVTRNAVQNRDKIKRKIKRRGLDRQNSTDSQSVSADVHHIADLGLRSDDSLPQPVHSVAFFPLPD
jgi:hypothetical protein